MMKGLRLENNNSYYTPYHNMFVTFILIQRWRLFTIKYTKTIYRYRGSSTVTITDDFVNSAILQGLYLKGIKMA